MTWSFAFSYLAVLGLTLFSGHMSSRVGRLLMATIGASVFTAPLAFFVFRIPSPLSPLANLVFLPLFVPILALGMVFAWLTPVVHMGWLAVVLDGLVSGFLWLVRYVDTGMAFLATPLTAAISYVAQMGILVWMWLKRYPRMKSIE